MTLDLTVILTSAVVAAIVSVIGNVILKRVEWGIEQRRERLKERKEFITEIRKVITSDEDWMKAPVYHSFKQMIKDEVGEELRKIVQKIDMLNGVENSQDARSILLNDGRNLLHIEITRLQKEWKLI